MSLMPVLLATTVEKDGFIAFRIINSIFNGAYALATVGWSFFVTSRA
jgi:hypothetical protein